MQDSKTVADKLASICNAILFQNATGSYVCNGFNYNTVTKIAYFKAQLVDQPITSGSLCNSPNVTTWLLETGRSIAYTNMIMQD